ncbi:dGTP triphosphohydrolase [Pseudochrobactrum sp. XF203]|uniref:dGTP triphosphohydrolase n=1 Tax=Pseudochrobactrum sp. XF203 TaxID=2879116 RepID=UPI001CE2EB7C|nr:dNTP triphosphohydrolase [Pseudochrobactrum sp. XF203]UCA46154.1 dNTP triphosphohydrolase [Pseudochrobactrum sp. XF203]
MSVGAKLYNDSDYDREVSGEEKQQADYRPSFSRDYGRIIHSASFRRQQGKTQVFPTRESDFFRNRLTHSLEVAQIAEGIADQINHNFREELNGNIIDGKLCATAGLVHDIGHPPFGHNGERALDAAMLEYGGFEGNAQTLRILARLEKKKTYEKGKEVDGDERAGFNLCYRTLAAVLKYDREIPSTRQKGAKLVKGYYNSERLIVDRIKQAVLNGCAAPEAGKFNTIECSIMDLADDIAYSVYDLEDCLKAKFLTPAGILASDQDLLIRVANEVGERLERKVETGEVLAVFTDLFDKVTSDNYGPSESPLISFILAYRTSEELCESGYFRTALSSQLVHDFIKNVRLEYNHECPALSTVSLDEENNFKKEVLKEYTYQAAVTSNRVKMGEYRGTDLVKEIFDALMGPKGELLMPSDVRKRYELAKDKRSEQARIVCDFVAGMTDRYAIEFWSRLRSDNPESIFKPI